MAICRAGSGDRNDVFTTSQDGNFCTWARRAPLSTSADSKPIFDQFNGLDYLGW